MLKFTIDREIYYLKESVIYGFNVIPVRDGFRLILLDTTDGLYELGTFENKEICDRVIYNIEMCVITGIKDIDFIIKKEIENFRRKGEVKDGQ